MIIHNHQLSILGSSGAKSAALSCSTRKHRKVTYGILGLNERIVDSNNLDIAVLDTAKAKVSSLHSQWDLL